MRSRLIKLVAVAAIALLVSIACNVARSERVSPTPPVSIVRLATQTSDPVIAAAGDIACAEVQSLLNLGNSGCQMQSTSDLLVNQSLTAVLPLGDLQYGGATLSQFQQFYQPTWGRVKASSRPVVGNHEYETPGATGYFQYFGAAAGETNQGYYSYDVGAWHLIALNSNCRDVAGGCEAGSPQEQWLKADLASHPNRCTLAYWHHPRFSSGPHGNNVAVQAFWQGLEDAGADVVLVGHDHLYERFAPQTAEGVADGDRGMRSFVVGTGGKSLYLAQSVQPHSEVRNSETYEVLELALHQDGYEWQFVPIAGQAFTDSGRAACH
jgi:hypothetical protein